MTASDDGKKVLVLEPVAGWVPLKLGELWEYRELVWFLAWRDISARYKQTAIGIAWAIVQPVVATLVFTVFFGRLARIPSDGWHYPVFVLAGMLPWQYFNAAVTNASGSLIRNLHLITKVYCPRLAIPLAALIPPLLEFAAGFLILLSLVAWYGMTLDLRVLVFPLLVLVLAMTALAVGLWLAALSTEFRDVQHILPFLMQMWMFASPVVYSTSLVPEPYRALYCLNPIAGVISAFRWMLGDGGAERLVMLAVSASTSFVLLVSGAYLFRRLEKSFADVV